MLLRTAFTALTSLIVVAAAAASETARTPGAYASLATRDAAACARACADDGICMAWSFRSDNQCDLSAVVSAPQPTQALAAGYASRAPAFLQPATPAVHAEPLEIVAPQAAPPPLVASLAEEAPVPPEPSEKDLVLLGGPLDGDLRLGLR